MQLTILYVFLIALSLTYGQIHNPSIVQDTRFEPKTDGTYGFLYRTEDGIAHGAKSNGDGVISGRFTYTDPTGLKVNFNYNAGSRATPGYNYNDQGAAYVPQTQRQDVQPASSYNPPVQVNRNQRESYSVQAQTTQDYYYTPQQRQINQNDLYSNYS